MLKKKYRLVKHTAFIATYRQSNVVSNEHFKLYGGKLKDEDSTYSTKLGFVISKKIHKRAVKRNRIKRLLRESCRLGIKNNEMKEISSFMSLIFVAKEPALRLDMDIAKKSVKSLIEKLSKKSIKGY